MSSVVIAGNTSGTVTLSAPDVAGTTVITLPATSGTMIVGSGGVVGVAQGGTGNSSLAVTAGGVVYTDGSKLVNVGAGTSGYYLKSNGASAPSWASVGAIGVGQTWQNVIGSRSSGTTYTNSTGRPIMVAASPNISGFIVVCAGITLISTGNNAGFSFIVPDSTTYSITGTINSWVELR